CAILIIFFYISFFLSKPTAEQGDHDGRKRNHNHSDYNELYIVDNLRKLSSEKIPGYSQRRYPHHRAADIVQYESAKIESHNTGKYRGKGTNNRDKAANDQRGAAVFMEKFFSHNDMLAP